MKKKVSNKFRKMSEVYYIFSREWENMLDFSDDSLFNMYHYESSGVPIENARNNGYFVGKQYMDVHIEMWKIDIKDRILTKQELYEDETFPNWWLDKVL